MITEQLINLNKIVSYKAIENFLNNFGNNKLSELYSRCNGPLFEIMPEKFFLKRFGLYYMNFGYLLNYRLLTYKNENNDLSYITAIFDVQFEYCPAILTLAFFSKENNQPLFTSINVKVKDYSGIKRFFSIINPVVKTLISSDFKKLKDMYHPDSKNKSEFFQNQKQQFDVLSSLAIPTFNIVHYETNIDKELHELIILYVRFKNNQSLLKVFLKNEDDQFYILEMNIINDIY